MYKISQCSQCSHCLKSLTKKEAHYGIHQNCFYQIFGTNGIFERFSRLNLDSNPLTNELPHLSSYFAGNYRKYEARLDATRYILKFQEKKYPDLVATEYACNLLAKHLQIPIPEPFSIIKYEAEYAFVVRNFTDNLPSPHNLVHLYHYMSGYDYTVKNICHIVKEQTHGIRDVETFLSTTLYDALIGNHDRHGRNLAIIETAKFKTLSPIYDNVSALGLESGPLLLSSWAPRGKIFTQKSTEPEIADYVHDIHQLGYFHVLRKFEKNLKKMDIAKIIHSVLPLSDTMKNALLRLITQRAKDFYETIEQL